MTNMLLDYSNVTEIFKEKLKIDNIVKKISSVFQNPRYADKIDYKPYFQRNYVWDDEKASYFIESILIGTEIPPIVLFQTAGKNEVIDGRQRYETIERFLSDKLSLKEEGLHNLKTLVGKKYSLLSEEMKESFGETRIRILQFSIVNEPKLDEEKEDKIKKEIFRRYNSGITPLQKEEIERAVYFNDPISNAFVEKISTDELLFEFLCRIILPISKLKARRRDKVNILISRIRSLITLPLVPIYSYAHGSSKSDIIRRYYYTKIANNDCRKEIDKFDDIIDTLMMFEKKCIKANPILSKNKLFYEVLYWGVSILHDNNIRLKESDADNMLEVIEHANEFDELWVHIINNTQRSVDIVFEATGSHYYSAINNRYNFVANLLDKVIGFDFTKHMKDSESFKTILGAEIENDELHHYKLNKPLPETLTIEDITSDMDKERFLIRPNYQRSEVMNLQKASYLMESILLGINIPPIFVYKSANKVKEVVDGQQRLLIILGFLGKAYRNEMGHIVYSEKNKFKLSKLRILDEINGQTIATIDSKFIDKILEFPMDVIEIDSAQNPDFCQYDLFLRLNTKPYPIKENTFEMWNAYVDKEIIIRVKEIADTYGGRIFRTKDNRMKVEELITSLAYLDYRMKQPQTEIIKVLNIYKKNNRICSRIMSKENVTKTLNDVSCSDPGVFLQSIHNIETFMEKIVVLIENNPETLRKLFSHKNKRTQYKTDQNFYFLWAMLNDVPLFDLPIHKEGIFKKVYKLFEIIQQAPDDYSINNLLNEIELFSTRQ